MAHYDLIGNILMLLFLNGKKSSAFNNWRYLRFNVINIYSFSLHKSGSIVQLVFFTSRYIVSNFPNLDYPSKAFLVTV